MDSATDSAGRLDAKRLLDLVGASLGLVLLSPLLALISLAVRMSSRGPILFCQERSGRDGKPFLEVKAGQIDAQVIDYVAA